LPNRNRSLVRNPLLAQLGHRLLAQLGHHCWRKWPSLLAQVAITASAEVAKAVARIRTE
jgi:hypothetical protein